MAPVSFFRCGPAACAAGFGFGPGCPGANPFRASFFGEDVAKSPSPRANASLPA
jgi:hypothetical protein